MLTHAMSFRKATLVLEYCRRRDMNRNQVNRAFDWLPVPYQVAEELPSNRLGELLVAIHAKMQEIDNG